jgi:hypothetical protein
MQNSNVKISLPAERTSIYAYSLGTSIFAVFFIFTQNVLELFTVRNGRQISLRMQDIILKDLMSLFRIPEAAGSNTSLVIYYPQTYCGAFSNVEKDLKFCHERFLQHHFQFIIHRLSYYSTP